jgi:hypothetical protein
MVYGGWYPQSIQKKRVAGKVFIPGGLAAVRGSLLVGQLSGGLILSIASRMELIGTFLRNTLSV